MSGLLISLPPKRRANPLFLLLLVTASAISASSPPATLPRGFLEQLPMFMDMPDKEYDVLFQATGEEAPDSPHKKGNQPTGKPE
ncbi:MAG TPA: hypothetical protein ENJ35_03535 [Gammaproteobacteria bacterium]|nr:hypothetical protein [Gammaproteobacteria bacterium]